jgi:hypothetical protein
MTTIEMKAIYKYVSKVDYAHLLLAGKVFHQTLGYFRDYEDSNAKQVIGDQYESIHLYQPLNGLQVNNHTTGTSSLLGMGFESSTRAGEIYVFCASLYMTDELKEEFGASACVDISRPRIFTQRWQHALPQNAKYFSRRVQYYEQDDVPGNIWPQPKRIATSKLSKFAYQKEYRFGFTTTCALDFGECSQQLIDRKSRPVPRPDEHHNISLNLGDLSDICKLHIL